MRDIDKFVENKYTIGLKIYAIRNINLYKMIFINLGTGFSYIFSHDNIEHGNENSAAYTSININEKKYGLSLFAELEFTVYKQFRITARYSWFTGFKIYNSYYTNLTNQFLTELNEMTIGAAVYF